MSQKDFVLKMGMVIISLLLGMSCMVSSVLASGDAGPVNKDSSGSSKQAEQLNTVAESLYQHVLDGNVNLVRQDIQQASTIFENSSFQGLTTVEGFHALSESLIEMKEATAQAQIQQEHWLTVSAKFRLAADSLTYPKQPMWLQYYKVLREDLNDVEKRAVSSDQQGLKEAYESLQNHYEVIRPAIIIQRKPEVITAVDSWISYAGGIINSSSSAPSEIQNMVATGEELFNGIFGKKKDDNPAFAPIDEVNGLWPWTIWAGSFIILALTYTGFRKYRGERDSFKSVTPKEL